MLCDPAPPEDSFSAQQAEGLMNFYGVSEAGNFEGRNILHLAAGADATPPMGLDEMRRALYEARAERVWPGLDDKRLTAWNALMIAALAEAGAVLGREDYLKAAGECAAFVWGQLRDDEGALLRTYKDGRAHLKAYLEDHAFLLEALLTLYEAGFEAVWFERARELADTLLARFADNERGGFFSTCRRPRIADRPAQGDRRPPNSLGQLRCRLRPAAPRRPDRRACIRASRRGSLPPLLRLGRQAPRGLRPPAQGNRLPALPDQGGGPGRRGPERARRGGPQRVPAPPRAGRWPRGQRYAAATEGPWRSRRQPGRLRLRTLHLPHPDHRPKASRRGSLNPNLREPAGTVRSRTASPAPGTRPTPAA